MPLPTPEPGLVISYSYLWCSEAETGSEEGLKDRPCAIIVTTINDEDDATIVMVCPVTHTRPDNPDQAVEIPLDTKKRLKLDDEASWIIVSEINRFVWPGPDLRRTPSGRFEYGFLPKVLFEQVRSKLLQLHKSLKVGVVDRSA